MKPLIELSKARDFNDLINDTFTFIKQNFKPLITYYFTFCGIFLLGAIVSATLQQMRMTEAINSANAYGTETSTSPFSSSKIFSVEYFVSLTFILLTYVMLSTTVLSYVSLYQTNGKVKPTANEVWGYIKYFFLRMLGSNFLVFLLFGTATGLFILFGIGAHMLNLIILGFIICFVLGFWLFPIISILFPIMVIENTSFWYAFKHSFRLIKDYWWITFGTLAVIMIIVYVCMMIIVLPTSVANGIHMVIHMKDGASFSAGLTIATVILQQLAFIFYMVPVITAALCYFNLTETKEGTGMLNRINTFGSTDAADRSATSEDY